MSEFSDFPDVPFTWPQARALGISRAYVDDAVRNRLIVRPLRGVYLRADVEPSLINRALAAGLVVSSHSVLCDRTAAWIHGCDVFDFRELDVTPPLESYVLRGHDPTDRPECDGGTRDLCPDDWIEIDGVRVTTPLRTALDLGCALSRRRALAAMDSLMRAHGFDTADLRRMLRRYSRRRGVVQLRELVELVDGRSESSGESWTRLEIIDSGLPSPEPQYWVCIAGVPTYRLDLAYPHARVAVEYDGEEFHSSPDARANDGARRRWLQANGWKVIVVDKNSFTPTAIADWIAEVRGHLGLASPD